MESDRVRAAASTLTAETIFATFQLAVNRWRDRPFLHAPSEALQGGEAVSYTFEQAARRVETLKARYAAAGYGPGHRVGLALDNHPEFFLHFLSLNALGISVAPLNSAMRDAELAQIVALANMDLIVSWPVHLNKQGGIGSTARAALPTADANAEFVPQASRSPEARKSGAADEAALVFTSGTSGTPKGCVLSNDYFVWMGHFYTHLGGYCAFRPEGERLITPLPVTHMNALASSFMATMMSGSCLIQLDRFHASTWWQTARHEGATIVHYLGVMPAVLLQRPDLPEEYAGHQIRFGFGAGVDPRHHALFEERYGFPLIEAWAMTETGAGAWISANREPRHVGNRCFGKPPADLEIRLVNEAGEDVADDESGELLVRSQGDDPRRHFFSGYHNDPAATEAAWEGCWFHTGDIVRRDAEGSIFFVDRSKNIIRRSGENIASVEVENTLLQHPAVEHCAVLPVNDEIRGEEVMALIEVNTPAPDLALAEDITRFCLERLQYYKAPGYISFVDALPTTDSQKLRRGAIRELGRTLLEQQRSHDLRTLKRGP
jgi:acyl-CoA synthetase (AMP-forming)/AMP-acid ligase II